MQQGPAPWRANQLREVLDSSRQRAFTNCVDALGVELEAEVSPLQNSTPSPANPPGALRLHHDVAWRHMAANDALSEPAL
jgi:hypothetical protein